MASVRTFSVKRIPDEKKQNLRGQQLLIVNFLEKNPNSSIPAIANGIKADLQTRQDPERVVAFYMSTMKKKGWISVAEAQADEATTTGDVAAEEDDDDEDLDDEEEGDEAEVDADSAASTGATEEERMAAAAEADLEAHSIRLNESMKLSDALTTLMTKMGGTGSIGDWQERLQSHGYTARRESIQGALSNLVRRGVVVKENNEFGVRA